MDHIPSGSSGGSGAAIGAGLCFAATGSDTGGSIRAPASANGIAGIKPTYGRVSKAGVVVLSWSLDHVGPMARTVRDLAILLNIMAGQDPLDPHSKDVAVPDYVTALTGDIRGVRLGVPTDYFSEDVQPEVADAVAKAIIDLESLGAKVVPVEVSDLDGAPDCMLAIAMSEAAVYHQSSLRKTPELFGEETRLLLQSVSRIGSREESVFGVSARFCAPCNLSGLPAASIPCGLSAEKMPIGLQIIGRPFGEATILRVADAYERHTRWHLEFPAISN